MNQDDLESFLDNLSQFSLIFNQADSLTENGTCKVDYQELLTSLASIFRRRGLAYHISYQRPDQPVFKLRSEREFGDDVLDQRIEFAEPERTLDLQVDNPGESIFGGIVEELKILGDLEETEQDKVLREPELNLLTSRAFQVELYSEYQRWKRYKSPFLIGLVQLKKDCLGWKPVGRVFKHISRTRDIVGLLEEGRLAGFFPSIDDPEPIKTNLFDQLEAHYKSEELALSFFSVPDDFDNWSSLKKHVFPSST